MDAEIVFSGGDDRRKSRALWAVLSQYIVKDRLILIFVHARPGGFHHGSDPFTGDLFRLPHGFQLAGLFDGAQPAEDRVGIFYPQIRVIGSGAF